MCDPVSAAVAIGGAIVSSIMAPDPPKMQAPAPVTAPPSLATPLEKPPQAKQAPTAATFARKNAAEQGPGGAFAGLGSTFLTGSSGVAPGALSLGRSTLLGQ